MKKSVTQNRGRQNTSATTPSGQLRELDGTARGADLIRAATMTRLDVHRSSNRSNSHVDADVRANAKCPFARILQVAQSLWTIASGGRLLSGRYIANSNLVVRVGCLLTERRWMPPTRVAACPGRYFLPSDSKSAESQYRGREHPDPSRQLVLRDSCHPCKVPRNDRVVNRLLLRIQAACKLSDWFKTLNRGTAGLRFVFDNTQAAAWRNFASSMSYSAMFRPVFFKTVSRSNVKPTLPAR